MSSESNSRPVIPRTIRSWAVPIILAWVALTAGLNLLLPQVEIVSEHNAVSMSPQDAPSVIAAKRIGATFEESTSDSLAMVVLVASATMALAALALAPAAAMGWRYVFRAGGCGGDAGWLTTGVAFTVTVSAPWATAQLPSVTASFITTEPVRALSTTRAASAAGDSSSSDRLHNRLTR